MHDDRLVRGAEPCRSRRNGCNHLHKFYIIYIMRNATKAARAEVERRKSRNFRENKAFSAERFRIARQGCWLMQAQAAK